MSAEDSPSCLPRLRLTLSSSWRTLFIGLERFCLFFPGSVLVLFFRFPSRWQHSPAGLLGPDPDGPDMNLRIESSRLAIVPRLRTSPSGSAIMAVIGYRGHDLSVVLACHDQLHITPGHAVLGLPGYLSNLCLNPFLPLT